MLVDVAAALALATGSTYHPELACHGLVCANFVAFNVTE
jgi:hypothetical protein